ncbi:MAG: TIGR00282 family metallophosphoesterase [Ruminococcus sp.]|nr:TIGR00282 family metallophosphoesterase [Ruminococcus sp.]
MKLLFLGDVVGAAGVEFVKKNLWKLKRDNNIDITVINGENSAQGNGITPESFDELIRAGADVITTGNHCFRRKEMLGLYDERDDLLRPANYPEGVIGKGVVTVDLGRAQVAVVNLMGTVYLDALDNPFSVIDKILSELNTSNIIVDFHAEATAEKKAMGYYLDGKVTAVLGTHTHVQTADEVILEKGTAYITDVGMTGPEHSVLGVEKSLAIEKLRKRCPVTFKESSSECFLNAVIVTFNERNGRAEAIERLIIR